MSGSELPNNWRTSSHSDKVDCVEVADNEKVGAFQDSKNRGPAIVVPRTAYVAFLRTVVARPTE